MRPGPWLLALVCWFAACAGVQLLHPQELLQFPGWWPGQLLVSVCQLASVILSAWLLRRQSALAQWLGLLAWWAWPWHGLPQWLRVTPLQCVWQLAWVIWLLCLVQRRLTGAWAATLVMAALLPASLAGAAAGLGLTGQGRQRWAAVAIAGLAMLVEFQAPGWEQLAWAGLALTVGWLRPDVATRAVAAYTLICAAKGGPTTSAMLALAAGWAVDRWGGFRPLILLVGTWALGNPGETALNRSLIVPWQKQKVSLAQGLLPHGLAWWARTLGSRYGLTDHDQAAWEWLRGRPPGKAVVTTQNRWDDPLIAQVYAQLSDGQVLPHPSPWGLAALKSTDQLAGTGLDWWVQRGSPKRQDVAFASGSVVVWKNAAPNLPAAFVTGCEVLSATGPGGLLHLNLAADGPAGLGHSIPRLVLQPGPNYVSLPLHGPSLEAGAVRIPAQDIAQQLESTKLTCQRQSLPAHSVEWLTIEVENSTPASLHLQSLGGLRVRWPGQDWQPLVATPVTVGPGQVGRLEVPLQTPTNIARLWLELVWEEPSGLRHPAGRLRFDLWPQQQPERYLELSPPQSLFPGRLAIRQ